MAGGGETSGGEGAAADLSARLLAGIVAQKRSRPPRIRRPRLVFPVLMSRVPRSRAPRELPRVVLEPPPRVEADLVYAAGFDDVARTPLVLVSAELAPGEATPLHEAKEAHEVVTRLAGAAPPGTRVVGIPAPQPYVAPGAAAYCFGKDGTLGAAVTTKEGRPAFLTAGHFGSPSGSRVSVGDREIGTVRFSVDPIAAPLDQITADVALVELDDGVAVEPESPPIRGSCEVAGGAEITCLGAVSGAKTSEVSMRSPYVHVPAMRGMWSDCYVTLQSISAPGDSGAPVVDAGGRLVGHLVGGAPGVASFVEAIDVQLRATGASLAHD